MSSPFNRLTYLVVLFFFFFFLPVKVICHLQRRLVHFTLFLVSWSSFNISPSLQTGVFCFYRCPWVRGSAIELIVAGTSYRGLSVSCDYRGMREMIVGVKCKLTDIETARHSNGGCVSYCRFRGSKPNERRNLIFKRLPCIFLSLLSRLGPWETKNAL